MQLERRPVPVFKDPAKATSPELSDDLLAEVEGALGAVPPALVQLFREEQNGGKLRRSLFPSSAPGLEGAAQIGYLLGLGGPRGMPALQVLAAHWRYPVEGLLLASEGARALFVEAASGAVIYVDMKHPSGVLRIELASDIASFLAGLVDGSPSCDWVLGVELKGIQERLGAAGWEEGDNHYGIRRFTRPEASRLELRVFPNQSRDGEGFSCVEHSECALVAQLHGLHEAVLSAAEALDEAFGVGALRVNTPHPAAKPVD
ncbi:MAG: hypothetical protein JKY65_31485 [Planctomycetes bacterium]|nr:hypothetical protein [Planctomycetota bacterium]